MSSEKRSWTTMLSQIFHSSSNNNHDSTHQEEGKGLFGSSLEYAAKQCPVSTSSFGLCVPVPVARCFTEIIRRGLKIEGIFRLSGAASEVSRLEQELNRPPHYGTDVDLSAFDIHAITSVVKAYLRKLPEPVIPRALHGHFLHIADQDMKDQEAVKALAYLIALLPEVHSQLLHYILILASAIQEHENINKMNPEALAVVLAPVSTGLEQRLADSVLNKRRNIKRQDMNDLIRTNARWTHVWTLMIEHYSDLSRIWPTTYQTPSGSDDNCTKSLYHHSNAPNVSVATTCRRCHHHRPKKSYVNGPRHMLRRLASASSLRSILVH